MANLIVVCGPQAVGKMTVAESLRDKLKYNMMMNHDSIEISDQIFGFGTPAQKEKCGFDENEARSLIHVAVVRAAVKWNPERAGFAHYLWWQVRNGIANEYAYRNQSRHRGYETISMDAFEKVDHAKEFEECLATAPLEDVVNVCELNIFGICQKVLSEREMRYVVEAFVKDRAMKVIGEEDGISRQRVEQVMKRAFKKIRRYLDEKGLTEDAKYYFI